MPASAGDRALAAIYRNGASAPAFVPAFRAWLAQRPFTNRRAVPGRCTCRSTGPPSCAAPPRSTQRADAALPEGTQAKTNDDRYILSTVFFAAVLFFAGISLRLRLAAAADHGARPGRRDAARRRGVRALAARRLTSRPRRAT